MKRKLNLLTLGLLPFLLASCCEKNPSDEAKNSESNNETAPLGNKMNKDAWEKMFGDKINNCSITCKDNISWNEVEDVEVPSTITSEFSYFFDLAGYDFYGKPVSSSRKEIIKDSDIYNAYEKDEDISSEFSSKEEYANALIEQLNEEHRTTAKRNAEDNAYVYERVYERNDPLFGQLSYNSDFVQLYEFDEEEEGFIKANCFMDEIYECTSFSTIYIFSLKNLVDKFERMTFDETKKCYTSNVTTLINGEEYLESFTDDSCEYYFDDGVLTKCIITASVDGDQAETEFEFANYGGNKIDFPTKLIPCEHDIGISDDNKYHYRYCYVCSNVSEYEEHKFKKGVCEVCNRIQTEEEKVYGDDGELLFVIKKNKVTGEYVELNNYDFEYDRSEDNVKYYELVSKNATYTCTMTETLADDPENKCLHTKTLVYSFKKDGEKFCDDLTFVTTFSIHDFELVKFNKATVTENGKLYTKCSIKCNECGLTYKDLDFKIITEAETFDGLSCEVNKFSNENYFISVDHIYDNETDTCLICGKDRPTLS